MSTEIQRKLEKLIQDKGRVNLFLTDTLLMKLLVPRDEKPFCYEPAFSHDGVLVGTFKNGVDLNYVGEDGVVSAINGYLTSLRVEGWEMYCVEAVRPIYTRNNRWCGAAVFIIRR